MGVPSYDIDAVAALIVPDAHGLVIGGRKYPWQFVVEIGGSDVVDVPFQGK